MRKIANLLSGLFLILVFIVSIVFTYFNSAPISIQFGPWQFEPLPVSVWIIGAFVSGAVLGLLLGLRFFSGMRARAEARRLNKQLNEARGEIQQLRSLAHREL